MLVSEEPPNSNLFQHIEAPCHEPTFLPRPHPAPAKAVEGDEWGRNDSQLQARLLRTLPQPDGFGCGKSPLFRLDCSPIQLRGTGTHSHSSLR